MARTTKIPCEGAIYTVHRDAYGIVTEMDVDASAEEPPEADDPMSEERARYAQVIQELTEFEEAIARAEAQNLLAEHHEERNSEDDNEPDLLL
jgi:hypothetical protein